MSDDEASLLTKFRAGCLESRNRFIEANLPYIAHVAGKARISFEEDDKIQEAVLVAINCLEDYCPDNGTFENFFRSAYISRSRDLINNAIVMPERDRKVRKRFGQEITISRSDFADIPDPRPSTEETQIVDLSILTETERIIIEGTFGFADHGITQAEICKAARVSNGTYYTHKTTALQKLRERIDV
jgi:RNA polymerase sigma factor (sigma-70 family)